MKSKSLQEKASTLHYSDLHDRILHFVEDGKLEEIYDLLKTNTAVLINSSEEAERTISLIEKVLEAINNSQGDFHALRENLINGLGVLCGSIGLRKEALNFYILALIGSESKKGSTYCNNIGAALADFGDFYLAKKFYQEALELNDFIRDLSTDKDKRLHNIIIINQAIANINLGNTEAAKENLRHVYDVQEGLVDDIYNFACWHIEMSNYDNVEDAYSYIKEIELDKSGTRLHYSYFLRKFLFEKYENIPIETKYSILSESFAVHDKVSNIYDKKDTILQLIHLAKELGKREDEYVFQEALYQLSLSETNHNSNATRILVEQFLLFFNNLSRTNKKTKHQKKELTKLTFLLSHNLKTPVRNIRGFTDLIRKSIKPNENQDIEEYFNFINKGCSELYQLLDNINQIAHFNNKAEKEIEVDLNVLLKSIEFDLRKKYHNNIHISLSNKLPMVLTRPNDMKKLFEIIIENGIKFNDTDQPQVSVNFKQERNKLIFLLTDNGIGIDPAYHLQIFDFFTKLEPNHVYPGTGFGLGMAKKILDYYDGNIKLIQSRKEEGSVFSIELPQNIQVDQNQN